MEQGQEAEHPEADELRDAAERSERKASESMQSGDFATGSAAIDDARMLRAFADHGRRLAAIERALGIRGEGGR